jgi:hypothetical protein
MKRLAEFYALDQPIFLYEAAQYVISEPRIQRITLGEFGDAVLTPITTAYFPPARESTADANLVTEFDIPSVSRARDTLPG